MAVAPSELDFVLDFLQASQRVDGRGLDERRDVLISSGCLKSYCGSCVATLGDTRCVCTLSASLGLPEDKSVIVDVRLSPLSRLLSGMDRTLRNTSNSAEHIKDLCQRTLEKALESAELMINDRKLCIGLVLFFSTFEMPDAVRVAFAAADGALRTSKIPKPVPEKGQGSDEPEFVNLSYKTVQVTTSSSGLIDPTPLEYKACEMLETSIYINGEVFIQEREGVVPLNEMGKGQVKDEKMV